MTQTNDFIGWMKKNNRAARAARFLVQFFYVVWQMATWNVFIQGLRKHDVDGSENVIWKSNFVFLQSFLSYSNSLRLQNVF